ncbi:MAG: cell division ATPase MinD [Candidatus Aenigmatarchaeota archaeon]
MRVITIASGKGGVGKTTVTSNLGLALTKLGKSVTIIDANITTPHLAMNFGMFYNPTTLNHVLREESKSIIDAIYFHDSGLKIIPSSLDVNELQNVDIMKLEKTIKEIPYSDFVLIDSAPGIGREAVSAMKASKEILYVTNPNIAAVTDVIKINDVAEKMGLKPLGVVVNKVSGKPYELTIGEIEDLVNLPVIAAIPFDRDFERALALGKTYLEINDYSRAAIEFMKLASNIAGEEYKVPISTYLKRVRSWFSWLI